MNSTEAQGSSRRLRARLIGWSMIVAVGAVGGCGVWLAVSWPDIAVLAHRNPETTAFMERHRARSDSVDWRWVSYEGISPHLKRAVLVAEDIGFFQHNGFAVDEITAALGQAIKGERGLRGASTITQQLAKNLWLSPKRSLWRKFQEAILARQLERHLTKRRILELYLNVAEFGPGIYGAEAAAHRYFGVSARELSESQAAELAAVLPRPSTWRPGISSPAYRNRVAWVREWMARAEFLWRHI